MDAEITVDNKNTVAKSNKLIEAGYKLSLNESRMILMAISTLDSRKPMPDSVTLNAKDFAETYKISENKAYEALEDAANRLFDREFKSTDGKTRTRKRWVNSAKYHDGEGSVTLSFTPHIIPLLTTLNSNFTTYKLKYISGLRSVYSIRLFEMLMRFKKTGVLIISVDDFRERLELENKYTRFTNLKARVIDPAIKELKALGSLKIRFETKKEGRIITQLRFIFKPSKQMMLDFS